MGRQVWRDIADEDDMKAEIFRKIQDEEEARMAGIMNRARRKRLERKEVKMKMWKEMSKMMNIIKDMGKLRLETCLGAWDEWMLELQETGMMDDECKQVHAIK